MAKLVKHDFVDEYPYIAYAEKADTAASAAGGAGDGIAVAGYNADENKILVKAGALFEIMQTKPVFILAASETAIVSDLLNIASYDEGTGYEFDGVGGGAFTADTADDYPTADMS